MGIWSLYSHQQTADKPQLVAVVRKKDESKRRGELARKRVNVRGRQSQRDEVAEMLRRRGREMWASDGALLGRERAIRTEGKGRDGMENSN